jgi:CRISPR-associated protein Csm1
MQNNISNMDSIRNHVYLAALLHDIGKFYQRADEDSTASSKILDERVKNLENVLLPSFNGKSTHKHALWTAQFIVENESVFRKLTDVENESLTAVNSLLQIAAGHHLPYSQQSELGRIIKEADSLASGMDRDSELSLRDNQDETETNRSAYKTKRMTSILETIGLSSDELMSKTNWRHLPVESVTLSKSFFPRKEFDSKPDYGSLWKNFVRDFKFIQAGSYKSFSETLLHLLFKYSSSVPASTIHFPDVSLYDHLKMTAALAVSLYDIGKEEASSDNPFLLIGADISGIQTYIYQIVSKYAAKNLKGRSFYLRLLTDAVVNYILKELNLFQANVIYNSGGSFYILAPNTVFVRSRLQDIVKTIEEKMFENHGTTLFLAIDSVPFSKDALMHRNDENLQRVWSELFLKRDVKKSQKFAGLIQENYSDFFMPTNFGIETDKITGEGISRGEKTKNIDEIGKVKYLTYQQIELGRMLRDTELIAISDHEIVHWKDYHPIEPLGLGQFFYFFKKDDFLSMKEQLKGSADQVSFVTLNGRNGNCEFLYANQDAGFQMQGSNNIYGLSFYGGNHFDGSTFDEFCRDESESSFRRLGVLRMDVDNLGYIFQKGMLPERTTLSRYAALSRSFDYFFSGYLNTIQQETAPHTSFIIYSGGDDLFIIAAWNDTIRLAKKIRNDFREFACFNPAFSVSGGIAIVTPKFPIMRGARESEEEEKSAKNHICGEQQKNALSFIGLPLNWESEFPVVEKLKDKIVHLTANKLLPKSFIEKIRMHAANAEIKDHKVRNLKIFWLVPYDLSRMESRIKSDESKKLIENCKLEVCGKLNRLNGEEVNTHYHLLELWAFAARWAELELRTNQQY